MCRILYIYIYNKLIYNKLIIYYDKTVASKGTAEASYITVQMAFIVTLIVGYKLVARVTVSCTPCYIDK